MLREATIIRFGHEKLPHVRANPVECNICLAQFKQNLMCYKPKSFRNLPIQEFLIPAPRFRITNFRLLLVFCLLHLCIKISAVSTLTCERRLYLHMTTIPSVTLFSFNPFALGDFAEKRLLKLVEWFSGHCRAVKSNNLPQSRFQVVHFAAFRSSCKI